MTIMLSKSTEDWLRREVAAGRFASMDEAVEVALQHFRVAMDDVEDDDLLQHKASIDEAIAQLDRGEGRPAEEVFERLRAKIAKAG